MNSVFEVRTIVKNGEMVDVSFTVKPSSLSYDAEAFYYRGSKLSKGNIVDSICGLASFSFSLNTSEGVTEAPYSVSVSDIASLTSSIKDIESFINSVDTEAVKPVSATGPSDSDINAFKKEFGIK